MTTRLLEPCAAQICRSDGILKNALLMSECLGGSSDCTYEIRCDASVRQDSAQCGRGRPGLLNYWERVNVGKNESS